MISQIWDLAYQTTVPYLQLEMQFHNGQKALEQISVPTSTPRPEGGLHLHSSDPTHNRGKVQIVNSFAGMSGQLRSQQADKEPSSVQTLGKGGKKKSSQGAQANTQPQPSTSSNPSPRNTGTGRPQVHCSACGGNDHLRKDCQTRQLLYQVQVKVTCYKHVLHL